MDSSQGVTLNNDWDKSYEKSYQTNCFREHLLESIKINRSRKKDYARLTNGKSNKIFSKLIAYEYLSLVPATLFDMKARKYQKKGMDIFCHEFMSMKHAPSFDITHRKSPRDEFTNYDIEFVIKKLKAAIAAGDDREMREISISALLDLKKMPSFYCMTRHMIESIYRFAHFYPKRREQAKSLSLKDPARMILNVIHLHVLGLKESYNIDLLSYPIQKSGIPILCSELPDLLFDINENELEDLRRNG